MFLERSSMRESISSKGEIIQHKLIHGELLICVGNSPVHIG